jgi:hypothetical protein
MSLPPPQGAAASTVLFLFAGMAKLVLLLEAMRTPVALPGPFLHRCGWAPDHHGRRDGHHRRRPAAATRARPVNRYEILHR